LGTVAVAVAVAVARPPTAPTPTPTPTTDNDHDHMDTDTDHRLPRVQRGDPRGKRRAERASQSAGFIAFCRWCHSPLAIKPIFQGANIVQRYTGALVGAVGG
jgi:hypothetical protein